MSVVDKLVDWYLCSPIYKEGSYRAYYSTFKKGLIYPEITAYAISLSCVLYKKREENRFLERAETCAKYMMKVNQGGAVPCFSDNLLYAFDTGIFVSSMFDLYDLTKKQIYLDEAQKSLSWLYSQWDKRPFSSVDVIPEKADWYHLSSVHLAKLAIPLIKASIFLEDRRGEAVALALLDNFRKLQMENGSFSVNKGSETVFTHPHCYATEGFLYAYYTLRRHEFLEAAKRSSDWLSKMQNSDGSLYRCYNAERRTGNGDKEEKVKTSDATAQVTRIWKLLGVNQEGVDKAFKYLSGELNENGLRLFRNVSLRSKIFPWGSPGYSWPTLFYLHSLLLPFGRIEYCKELF